ncbi:hypothetical protein SAMN03080615_00165 [Amphritea atlantica]|uniref:Nucleotidyl transferase AbiEii toxin, Type IV TA system n=1 Tax=Amphritea atlantica TaxID=355243 RepID=A0A1H9CU99_9GAMM|nr:hypothetical protein [Amphritea atlantica]SEQ04667.1 hypothetical protein SAMN03080615_00165 [Amphritea atlantica]
MADQSVIHKAITARDLAGLIASHLAAKGIEVTLVGGTCVSIYSDNFYQSDDLDFVDRSYTPGKKLKDAMSEIGFTPVGRYFEHPDSPFVVEFPSGPLSVGDDPVRNWSTLSTPLGTFTLITPEDCIKDRLAAYFHWNDRQALEQAVWVAHDQVGEYRPDEIEKWAEREGEVDKFKEFIARLKR